MSEAPSRPIIEPKDWPSPADFAAPPTAADRARWAEADRAARPARLAGLRARMAEAGVDGYFGLRWEHMRYLTGLPFDESEVMGSGDSGKFLVGMDELWVLADSRYTIAVRRDAPGATLFECSNALVDRWPELLATAGVTRVAVEAMTIPHLTWEQLVAAAPDVELVPIEGWVEADRATKEPSEIERIAAACAVADRALATLLPEIRPGRTERELALRLEWLIRTGGAGSLAFEIACLAGPEAALPHGSPGYRPVTTGAVLLFDFGAQVAGYRSDMTRTLFIGEPSARDLAVYELVARAQAAALDAVRAAASTGDAPTGRAIDAAARSVIEAAGHGEHFGHGTGHGIGLATHEEPRLSRTVPERSLPAPTVFSVEPGVYLVGETGVRIEDLVAFDPAAGRAEELTRFPRGIVVI